MNPTCSIIITVYNCGAHVGAAIESALTQSYQPIEVIVVNDGSTDDTAEVLARFGNRIAVITQPNRGQLSAANAGFARSSGDLVCFLDADDLLDPDTIERICRAWTPTTSKVHFRLRMIDADGAPIGARLLPPYRALPQGDLSATLRRFGFYSTPPTSGNAFARRVLQEIMPLPEDVPLILDTVLIGYAALRGTVAALDTPGGCWRRTGYNISRGGLDKLQFKVRSDEEYIRLMRAKLTASEDQRGTRRPLAARWPQYLKDRLIVERFGGAGRRARLGRLARLRDYLATICVWPEYTAATRVKFAIWAIIVCAAPHWLLRRVPGIAGPNVILS
jgi:glycosyltransferase involved in cell wall biosynthesis